MPRPAKPWKRKEDGWYYANINGIQEKLSPDRDEAWDLFHKLKGAAGQKKKGSPAAKVSTTLEEVCNAFLDEAKATKEEKTYQNQRGYLQSFCDYIGKTRRVRDIGGDEFNRWSREQNWGTSTQAAARATVMACFNWGVRVGKLLDSPLWGLKKGRYERRDRILNNKEKEKIRANITGNIKDLLYCLEMTGCRPFSEAGQLTAAMIDWQEGMVTLEKHKNKGKGKRRVIYLPPALLERLRQLAKEHPEGPLLRTRASLKYPEGRVWTRAAASKAMKRLERKTGIQKLNIYTWRHTFITDCLAKGMSATIVGKLVGNSARTIARFYEHVEQKRDELKAAARQAVE